MYVQTYSSGRTILKIIIVIGWIGAGLGAILLLVGLGQLGGSNQLNRGMGLTALPVAIALLGVGLTQIAVGVVGQAILDQADLSRASLDLMTEFARKNGIEASVAAQKGSSPEKVANAKPSSSNGTTAYAGSIVTQNGPSEVEHPDVPPGSTPSEVVEHRGKRIEKHGTRWYWKDQKFLNLGKAKSAINESL